MAMFNDPPLGNGHWGTFILNASHGVNAFPGNALTLTHEIGHIMGLAHRGLNFPAGEPDGVYQQTKAMKIQIANINIMSYEKKRRQKFDLIQAMAIQGSSAFAD